jgi:hypothetical protein
MSLYSTVVNYVYDNRVTGEAQSNLEKMLDFLQGIFVKYFEVKSVFWFNDIRQRVFRNDENAKFDLDMLNFYRLDPKMQKRTVSSFIDWFLSAESGLRIYCPVWNQIASTTNNLGKTSENVFCAINPARNDGGQNCDGVDAIRLNIARVAEDYFEVDAYGINVKTLDITTQNNIVDNTIALLYNYAENNREYVRELNSIVLPYEQDAEAFFRVRRDNKSIADFVERYLELVLYIWYYEAEMATLQGIITRISNAPGETIILDAIETYKSESFRESYKKAKVNLQKWAVDFHRLVVVWTPSLAENRRLKTRLDQLDRDVRIAIDALSVSTLDNISKNKPVRQQVSVSFNRGKNSSKKRMSSSSSSYSSSSSEDNSVDYDD